MFLDKFKTTIIKEIKPTDIDLMRKLLGSITIDFNDKRNNVEDGLTENQKRDLLISANVLKNNLAFKTITKFLINKQGNFSVREADNYLKVSFGRGTINGVELSIQETDRLVGLYEEMITPKKEFDKDIVI